jgi:hypothetical protein
VCVCVCVNVRQSGLPYLSHSRNLCFVFEFADDFIS